MNMTEIVRKLKAIAYALDQLEVKGHNNLDILLGSIQSLNQAAAQLEKSLKELEPKDDPEIKLELVPGDENNPA